MQIPMDLAVYGSNGQLAAIVEIKFRRGTSRSWAAELRRNLLAHGDYPAAEFFVVATPDRIYLWKAAGSDPDLVEPHIELDASPIFERILEGTDVDQERISRPAFELVVSSWLSELSHLGLPSANLTQEQQQLVDCGFVHALRGGRIDHGVAV